MLSTTIGARWRHYGPTSGRTIPSPLNIMGIDSCPQFSTRGPKDQPTNSLKKGFLFFSLRRHQILLLYWCLPAHLPTFCKLFVACGAKVPENTEFRGQHSTFWQILLNAIIFFTTTHGNLVPTSGKCKQSIYFAPSVLVLISKRESDKR